MKNENEPVSKVFPWNAINKKTITSGGFGENLAIVDLPNDCKLSTANYFAGMHCGVCEGVYESEGEIPESNASIFSFPFVSLSDTSPWIKRNAFPSDPPLYPLCIPIPLKLPDSFQCQQAYHARRSLVKI